MEAMLELNYGQAGRKLDRKKIDAWLADADDNRPYMIAPTRWLRFLVDVRRFVAAGWIEKAAAQEWLDHEIFACDPQVPLDNLDDGRSGLVIGLNGRNVVAIAREWAVIRNLGNDDCQMHPRQLQYQSRYRSQKPLVCVWQLKIREPVALVEN
jgi:hypothetical protein